ncbi:hypothetical protein Droror1_Dr00011209 [Drosera rotundifolia]
MAGSHGFAKVYEGMLSDNTKVLVLALSSSFFIEVSFIVKKKGLGLVASGQAFHYPFVAVTTATHASSLSQSQSLTSLPILVEATTATSFVTLLREIHHHRLRDSLTILVEATTATSFATRLREIRHHRLRDSLPILAEASITTSFATRHHLREIHHHRLSQSLLKPPPPPPSRPATASLRSATTASVTHRHSYSQLLSRVLVSFGVIVELSRGVAIFLCKRHIDFRFVRVR